jgi:aryl sulfotransferase
MFKQPNPIMYIQWPQKTRELQSNHFDSPIWNEFKFRDDDIIIGTYAKSGTTWMQQIISQLIFNGQEGLPVAEMSPWLDLRVPPAHVKLEGLEAQTHRRFIKTHLPVDALVYSPKAKYIYIARDGRDVVWSLYNHHVKANEKWYEALNDSPGLVGPPIGKPVDSVVQSFHDWLDKDGYPWWSYWENIKSWWDIRHLPNLKLVHFANLKKNMESEIRDIARFLEIPSDNLNWDAILKHCSFDYMKDNATASVPLGGLFWDGGAKAFIHKGSNGRWRDMLSQEESEKYEKTAVEKLGKECAQWLKTGDLE